jgi:hypothetical protein
MNDQTILMEEKEIKGLTIRSIIWLVGCTASILITIFTVYFNLKIAIGNLELIKNGDDKYNELRYKDLDNKIEVNSILIRHIQDDMESQKNKK